TTPSPGGRSRAGTSTRSASPPAPGAPSAGTTSASPTTPSATTRTPRSASAATVPSPGPGSPQRWHDFCVCNDILRYSEIPVLGICLGHQGLGHLLDGKVSSAPEAMHGRLSRIHHEDAGLFEGIPQDFPVVRYHSLAITDMGPDGNVTAWADDGVVMGIEHRRRPMWGVQFHPESVATEHGARLVENFYGLPRRLRSPRWRGAKRPLQVPPRTRARRARGGGESELRLRSIPGEPSTEALFERDRKGTR